jgi:D-alanine-D-alanine ligase
VQLAQELAVTAHRVLGCYGYSRTDMIWVEGSPSGMVFLETNTLPGMTKASFIPQQLHAAKISFHSFLEQQFLLARGRKGIK